MGIEKQIFSKVVELSHITNRDKFSIYQVSKLTEDGIRFRVDCGDHGSFETIKKEGEEEYNIERSKWVYVKGVFYTFISLSETYAGYPLIHPVTALAILNGTFQFD